jgi:TolB-like protein/tetratricopeptide (TPR) repeat protein
MENDESGARKLQTSVVITEAEATVALERILASRTFSRRPRSRDFLAYVVTEHLAGRSHSIKERTVARRALKRSESFDGRADASVRVQATRLRTSLAAYYDSEGIDDPVRIVLPPGSYVPVLERAQAPDRAASSRRASLGPGVVIVTFTDADSEGHPSVTALALTESLVHALSRFPGLRLLGPVDRAAGPTGGRRRRLGDRLDVNYVLEGTVLTSGSTVRVTVRVSDAATGDVVWSERFDRDHDDFTGFGGQDEIVREVAGLVGGYSGAIQRDALTRGVTTSNPIVFSAMQSYYEALLMNTPEAALQIRPGLEAASALAPHDPHVLAMLAAVASYLATDGDLAHSSSNWERAREYAREALRIDPHNAHATLVLGRASRGSSGPDAVTLLVRRAIELAPGNPSILADAGCVLCEVDEWDEGIAFIRESARLNPYYPTYRYMYLTIDSMIHGDYAAALVESTIFDRRFEFWGPLLHGLALDGLGHTDEARREISAARALEPDLELVVAGTTDLPAHVRDFLLDRLDSALAAK